MDIPVGVVAALALWPIRSEGAQHAAQLASIIADQPASKWPATVGEIAAVHYLRRPDLIDTAGPILRWSQEEHSEDALYAIKAVALAALKHGVLHYTGAIDPGMRSDADLMSWIITSLRHRADRSWLGEFHTPSDVTEALSRLSLGNAPPAVSSLYECAGGTGGMFRIAAQHLRHCGIDPHGWTWHLEELDPVAAAGAAVNFLVWDLGPKATVVRGNTLSRRDLYEQALTMRAEAEARRSRLVARAVSAVAQVRAVRMLEELGVSAPRGPSPAGSPRKKAV